jgi:outer membrane protein assembly factor BamB
LLVPTDLWRIKKRDLCHQRANHTEDMMASRPRAIFVGIRGAALAIDRDSGETLWRTELRGMDFVSITVDGSDLFAASRGRVYRLDPLSGDIRWCNELPGLGWGIVSLAGASQDAGAAEQQRRQAQAAAAAAS